MICPPFGSGYLILRSRDLRKAKRDREQKEAIPLPVQDFPSLWEVCIIFLWGGGRWGGLPCLCVAPGDERQETAKEGSLGIDDSFVFGQTGIFAARIDAKLGEENVRLVSVSQGPRYLKYSQCSFFAASSSGFLRSLYFFLLLFRFTAGTLGKVVGRVKQRRAGSR